MKKITICCNEKLAEKLEQIAKDSDRSISKTGSILLERAIASLVVSNANLISEQVQESIKV